MINQMVGPMFDMISTDLVSKNRICNQFLGYCTNPKYKEIGVEDYTIRVLKDKPAVIADDNFINNLYTQIKADTKPRKTLKVVHMSDPHIDMEYKVGALWSAKATCAAAMSTATHPIKLSKLDLGAPISATCPCRLCRACWNTSVILSSQTSYSGREIILLTTLTLTPKPR